MMKYKVILIPQQIEFEVEQEQTLLDAALAQGIPFPYRCKVGMCGMCLCKKIQGQVSYHLEPMLTDNEQSQGWIFPCQAYANSHLTLDMDE